MGAPDRRATEHGEPEIDEVDHRLVKLISQISDGARQITFETDAYRCKTLLSGEIAPSPTNRDDSRTHHHFAPLSRADRSDHLRSAPRPADDPQEPERAQGHFAVADVPMAPARHRRH